MPLTLLAAALLLQAVPADPTPLAGSWTVDLSVDPAQPYTRPMQLTLDADGAVTGLFYQSDIEAGRWRTQNGRLCVVFRTSDGVGPYTPRPVWRATRSWARPGPRTAISIFLWTAARPAEAP